MKKRFDQILNSGVIADVSVDQIDINDRRYAVSFDPDPSDLTASVAAFGIVNRVRLIESGDGYIPVAGLRRLLAVERLGMETVPALVYVKGGKEGKGDKEFTDADAMRIALLDNFPAREYTAVEASGIVSRLIDDFGVADDEVVGEFFDLLHLSRSTNVLRDLLAINDLSHEIRALCHARRYPLKPIVRWCGLEEGDRNGLLTLVSAAPFGSGVVTELLGFVSDIVKRDRIGVDEILKDAALREILEDEGLPSGVRGERIRERIRGIRYPIHTGLTKKFDDTVTRLGLPGGAGISHHPHFEADHLELTFRFHNGRDLKSLGEFLAAKSESEEIEDLLDMV